MIIFHGLFSWSYAELSDKFILKWSFNWVSQKQAYIQLKPLEKQLVSHC